MSKSVQATPNKSILLVDDEPAWLDALSDVLETIHVTVETTNNGDEALLKLKTHKPDLILSDVRMPTMSGFDLFEKIRSIPQYKDIPYVFMSSINDFEAKRVAKELGADDYVVKPYDTEDVKSVVLGLLQKFKK